MGFWWGCVAQGGGLVWAFLRLVYGLAVTGFGWLPGVWVVVWVYRMAELGFRCDCFFSESLEDGFNLVFACGVWVAVLVLCGLYLAVFYLGLVVIT